MESRFASRDFTRSRRMMVVVVEPAEEFWHTFEHVVAEV
jgi:hypothetical protein